MAPYIGVATVANSSVLPQERNITSSLDPHIPPQVYTQEICKQLFKYQNCTQQSRKAYSNESKDSINQHGLQPMNGLKKKKRLGIHGATVYVCHRGEP